MDPKQMFRTMLEFNKKALDNTFDAIALIQDQNERVVNTLMSQATWLPEEGRKAMKEWVETCKKGREDFKKMVQDGFKNVEKYFASGQE